MNRWGKICGVLLLATVAGCATPVKETPPLGIPETVDLERARALENEGDLLGAARQYLGLAREADNLETRFELTLQAGELLIRAGELSTADQVLQQLKPPAPTPLLEFSLRLAVGDLALKRSRAELALQQLTMPEPGTQLTQALMLRLHRLRAEAYALSGNALEAANELLLLEGLLVDNAVIADNQALILQTLSPLTDQALEQMQVLAPDVLAGWLELTRIAKAPSGSAQFQRSITEWRARFPDHPVLPQTIDRLRARLAVEPLRPTQVAVLLPSTGPFAEPAIAVRDGLLTAFYSDTYPERPILRFYDVAADGSNAVVTLQQAVAEGAQLIVGPLSKNAVTAVARSDALPVPVLALNQAELADTVPLPTNLYQFGLPPEAEARQAAERAWIEGHTRALILVPDGLWGSRIATSFRERWEALGGIVLEQQSYDSTKNDYSNPIKALFDLNESETRRTNLRRTLGTEIKFEPRRRQDVDVLFLGAFPRQARQIRPQLKFHHARDVPVIATSHIFTGKVDRAADRDMDDLLFGDTPWTLGVERATVIQRTQIAKAWPEAQERFSRLYAMGFDAYRLIPYLEWLQTYPEERYEGETGQISIDERGRIHRRLAWARFRQGAPDLIGFAPTLIDGRPVAEEPQQETPAVVPASNPS